MHRPIIATEEQRHGVEEKSRISIACPLSSVTLWQIYPEKSAIYNSAINASLSVFPRRSTKINSTHGKNNR
jgi:hypothetical protein